MTSPGRLQIGMYSFECGDAAALAEFCSGVLERPVDDAATPAYATIGFADPGPTWMFVHADEPGEGRNRLVLDLGGEEDWREQADRVEALGAKRVADHEVTGVARWVELRDPENNTAGSSPRGPNSDAPDQGAWSLAAAGHAPQINPSHR